MLFSIMHEIKDNRMFHMRVKFSFLFKIIVIYLNLFYIKDFKGRIYLSVEGFKNESVQVPKGAHVTFCESYICLLFGF